MGESIPLGAPVPVEQAVLETFFSHLGIFSYDKAKDNVEKEREANKSAGASWLALLAGLAHLAAAEKAYHSMTFLGQKLGIAVLGPPHGPGGPPRCSGSRRGGVGGSGRARGKRRSAARESNASTGSAPSVRSDVRVTPKHVLRLAQPVLPNLCRGISSLATVPEL